MYRVSEKSLCTCRKWITFGSDIECTVLTVTVFADLDLHGLLKDVRDAT